MEPFLPGEIPVMVLRYLAMNKCETAAISMIEEMPFLKSYIPQKQPKDNNSVYLRNLARLSFSANLKDVLVDYKNSKNLVEDIVENENIPPIDTPDTLLTKIQALQEILQSKGSSDRRVKSPVPVPVRVPTVECSTSTDFVECERCAVNKDNVTDSSCQTEEPPTPVQFGHQDDIPRKVFTNLLGDNILQEKLAQTINEHVIPSSNKEEGEDALPKIQTSGDTIDKFLDNLLQDVHWGEEDSNQSLGNNYGAQAPGPVSFPEVDTSLSLNTIFKEAEMEMLFGESDNVCNVPSTSTAAQDPTSLGSKLTDANISSQMGAPPAPSTPKPLQAKDVDKDSSAEDSSKETTPKRTFSASIKRITPTPLSSTSAAAPAVFNSSVMIESKIANFRGQNIQCTMKTVHTDPEPWRKMGRHSIAPKIPNLGPVEKVVTNVSVNKKLCPTKMFPEAEATILPKSKSKEMLIPKQEVNPVSKPGTRKSEIILPSVPSSSHKRKATPTKLTPEKARTMDSFYHEPKSSTVKKTPMPPCTTEDGNKLEFANENSQPDVTPMQASPPTADVVSSISSLKTISPNALQRLIASANRVGPSNSAMPIWNKKKSYSTPRKRRHVRSLTFATPPSLKAASPLTDTDQGRESDNPRKRKATKELSPAELRSKKRLNWPESVKKRETDNSIGSNSKLTDEKDSSMEDSIMEDSILDNSIMEEASTEANVKAIESGPDTNPTPINQNADAKAATPKIVNPTPSAPPPLPTILEESMSKLSEVSITQSPIRPPVPIQPQPPEVPAITISSSMIQTLVSPSGEQFSIITIPTLMQNGSTLNQSYQVLEDKQTLVPINLVPSGGPGEVALQMPTTEHKNSIVAILPQEQVIMNPTSILGGISFAPAIQQPAFEQNNSLTFFANAPGIVRVSPISLPAQALPSVAFPGQFVAVSSENAGIPHILSTTPETVSNPVQIPNSNVSTNESQVSTAPKPGRRSGRKSKKGESVPPVPSNQTDADAKTNKSKRKSRSNPKGTPKQSPGDVQAEETKRSLRSSSQQDTSPPTAAPSRKVTSKSPRKSPPELEDEEVPAPNKKHVRNKKDKKPPKKPAVTMSLKDLFGDTPTQSPIKPKKRKSGEVKLPIDVVAAQAVASQAVPLGGSPRRSPRRKLSTPQQPRRPPLNMRISPNENANPFPKENPEIRVTSAPTVQVQQSTSGQQEPFHEPFQLVPAPLGFPEPTPVKNFDNGYLNISNHGFNSPLITPLKSVPPSMGFNDSQFMLPPTPRMIEDHDSNSNSTHSLRLIYDHGGMYPVNLLTSTPMKHGVPRTPGRGSSSNASSSSNSRSPIHMPPLLPPERPKVRNESQENDKQVEQEQEQSIPPTIPSKGAEVEPVVAEPNEKKGADDKSDGELSSSDSEDNEPAKPAANMEKKVELRDTKCANVEQPIQPKPKTKRMPNLVPAFTLPKKVVHLPSSRLPPTNPKPSTSHLLPSQPPIAHPPGQFPNPVRTHPHFTSFSTSPTKNSQIAGAYFKVGGLSKQLTTKESVAADGLLGLQQQPLVAKKQDQKPVATVSALSKEVKSDEGKNPHSVVKNQKLGDLLNLVRRKNRNSE